MINISQLTTDIASIASALNGKWERNSSRDGEATWVILGQIVFLEGDRTKFPYEVMTDLSSGVEKPLWHTSDGKGYWAILK